ncbi:MAG TPA: dihydrolipoamide acetyltransferase family protein [Anaerolineales bacterium]|nr:dihydrolipoamide acetyltransferase family protein [Anaerolineales bacterium]
MPLQVLMPQLGESVVEGTITKWLKAVGEKVEEYEPLLEINTDKVDSEIPSPGTGVLLDILVPEGTTIQAGSLLAWIGEPGEKIPSEVTSPAVEAVPQAESVGIPAAADFPGSTPPAPGRDRELGFISPVVARMASEHNLDLYQIPGSGQGGRITKKDVLNYLELLQQAPRPAAAGAPVQTAPPPTRAAAPAPFAPAPTAAEIAPGEVLPMTPVRRAIAEHMVASKRTSPHVTTVMEVDLSRVVTHRQANKAVFARDGVSLTYTAYFVSAAVTALKAYPVANSSWSEGGIVLHKQINIGMATSLGEEGLIVPVIRNADGLSLLGIARAVNDLANRARGKKLQPEEVKGGTFTITNHGVSGSLFATPIINQPQCAILGVGAIQKRVVVVSNENVGDTIAIRPMAYLSLTFDHRILDGAIADTFLGKVVESLLNF